MRTLSPLAVLALLVLPGLVPFTDAADGQARVVGHLSAAASGLAAVWIGGAAYVFHACASPCGDAIQRVTPDGASAVVSATLPVAGRAAAVTDGVVAYVLVAGAPVVKFDPAAQSVTTLPVSVPVLDAPISAVWTGSAILVFGNVASREESHLVTIDPVSAASSDVVLHRPYSHRCGNAYVFSTNCPAPASVWFEGAAAAWDGSRAILFGGRECHQGVTDYHGQYFNGGPECSVGSDIYAVAPSGELSRVGSLGSARWLGAAVSTGREIVEIGGHDGSRPVASIVRYRLDQPRWAWATLPTPLDSAAAVWTGDAILVFGGSDGASARSEIVELRLAPMEPATASAVFEDGEVRLAWSAVEDATSYFVSRYSTYSPGSSWSETRADLGAFATTALVDPAPPAGVTIRYQIYAINNAGTSLAFAQTTLPTPPGAPAPRTSAGPPVGRIQLQWDPAAQTAGSPLTGFRVYSGTTPLDLALVASPAPTVSSWNATGLTTGESRYFAVSAVSAEGEGARSSPISGQAPALASAPRSPIAAPGDEAGSATLAWSPPASTGGVDVRYRVYVDGALAGESLSTTFVDRNRGDAALVSYRVSAVNIVGEGPLSEPANTTTAPYPPIPLGPPSAPRAVVAKRASPDAVNVSWQAPATWNASSISAYRVYRSLAGGPLVLMAEAPGSALAWADPGLPASAPVAYRVTALNAGGEGPTSAQVYTTAPARPGIVTGVNAQKRSDDRILVTWNAPSSDAPIQSYQIWRAPYQGSFSLVGETKGPIRSFVDEGGLDLYTYRVLAVSAAGEGTPGAKPNVLATRPLAPDAAYVDPGNPGTTHLSFDRSDEGFVRQNDQFASDVGWSSACRCIEVWSNNGDAAHERVVRDLPGGTWSSEAGRFLVTTRFEASGGRFMDAFPLFLGAAGSSPETSGGITARVLGFDSNPILSVSYRNATGQQPVSIWMPIAYSTEYRLAVSYDARSRALAIFVRSSGNQDVRSSMATLPADDTFAFDVVGVASYGSGSSYGSEMHLRVDDVRLVR